jgi:hypothetical protein
LEEPLTQERGKVILEILKYLNKHPESGDTLENIAMWWIPPERIRPLLNQVEGAVGYLVERGLIKEIPLPGGKRWYRVNLNKKKEAAQLLRSLSDDGWFAGPSI